MKLFWSRFGYNFGHVTHVYFLLDVNLIFGNAPRVLMSSEKTVSSGIQSLGLGVISSEMQSQHFQIKPYTS